MRRLLVPLLILAAAIPAAAFAARAPQPDGTLAVRDGRGKVTVVIKGSLIGRFGSGTLKIEDFDADEGSDPVVRGYRTVKWGRGNAPTYSGKNVRFRLIGGRFRVQFSGKGLFFSLVGHGKVMLDGSGSIEDRIFYDGFYSLNGAEEESLPDDAQWFQLPPQSPPPPPPPPSASRTATG
jgi:hypothetical protein